MDVILLKRVTSSTMWTTFLLWSAVHVVIKVKADDDDDDDNVCGDDCNYGCCGDEECCDPPGSHPSYTVQIIAVVGAFIVTLVLMFLCFIRYRCIRKIRLRAVRRRRDFTRRGRSNTNSSVFALDVDLEWPGNQGGQLVQPPPYSEQDPLSSPGSPGNSSGHLDPPPAYHEIVKDSVIVVPEGTVTQNSTHGEMDGNSRQVNGNSAELNGNYGEIGGNSGEMSEHI